MPNYDFHNCLSPREFEELVRDILEIKEGVPFELSGRGKDGGIDLRYWKGTTKIIVQVKCYQNNYKQLLNVLKNQEKQKAIALEPTRYILATSLALQSSQRDEVLDLFDGLIATRDDIIDRDDLNKLLGNEQYHNVERTHYKLWLSSTNILTSIIEDVVHRDICVKSRGELEEINRTVRVFVQNPSFGRAIDILENFKYVLISGEPGIGKTTLGRCLSAYFLQRKGFKEFIYANTVGTALRMYKENEKQVFFFDDFWGDTFKDEKLPHNEEKQILKFIKRISNSSNKILILTSREYVIQQGLTQYQDEQLKRTFDSGKCVLQLNDYSDLVKTKILSNHLYFSRLKWDYVKVIVDGYKRIINHSNYNPRIIENLLDQGSTLLGDITPTEYYEQFLKYLDEPLDFWKSIFMKQTYGAQLTALILFLSSQPMRLIDLKTSYYSCIEASAQINTPIIELEFDSIVEQLEKTMIKTIYDQEESTILVKFQNASIKDFLYIHLVDNIQYYGKVLVQGSPFINQLLYMFKAMSSKRRIYDDFEDGYFSKEKIRLPVSLENMLTDKIISDFDTLKYSYSERDVYEHKPNVHDKTEDCTIRKLQDILFNFEITEKARLLTFVRKKIQDLCLKLHKEDYPFSYDDMIEFPYLINAAKSLKIEFDGNTLINDYHERSRFSEHLLALYEFEEIFPKEFSTFKKINHKTIRSNIRYLLLDDIDFFQYDMEYDRIGYLIDYIYPTILESFKLRDSKAFRKKLDVAAEYDNNEQNEHHKKWLEDMNKELIIKENEERKLEEFIKEERDALLGLEEKIYDEDIINFIQKNTPSQKQSSEIIAFFKNEDPWYIWPFFSNLNRLSILLTLYHEEKNLPTTSAAFYGQLSSYLIKQNQSRAPLSDVDFIVEAFSQFAFDMMRNGEITFSEQMIENHPAFKAILDTKKIDLERLLSFPYIVQRGKWYEFQTLGFQAYLSVKRLLWLQERDKSITYSDLLDLNRYFIDNEHDIWILCSELDLENFYKYYLIPILQEYLASVDISSFEALCSSTFSFFDLTLNYKIAQDTLLPDFPRSCCNGLYSSALDFIGNDILDVEFLISFSDKTSSEDQAKLLRLSRFIKDHCSPNYNDEYELDLTQHSTNPEFLEILDSLGVNEFLKKFHQQILEKVEKVEGTKYSFRLDSYLHDSKTRRFASVD